MTFLEYKESISEGDLVILYINFSTMVPVRVVATVRNRKDTAEVENILQTKYGSLRAMELVGKRLGAKVQLSRGYGYVLQVSRQAEAEHTGQLAQHTWGVQGLGRTIQGVLFQIRTNRLIF